MYGTTLSQESIKVIAETIGVPNLPDEAAKELAEDVSYRLKIIIQVYTVALATPHSLICTEILPWNIITVEQIARHNLHIAPLILIMYTSLFTL